MQVAKIELSKNLKNFNFFLVIKIFSRSTCSGDSGGPLEFSGNFENDYVPKAIQYGIVSFGIHSCGVKSLPAIYTKVYPYLKWILDNMEG